MNRFIFALILCCSNAVGAATTYYIDYVGGADGNAGTSTGAAWKRHPYMAGFSGSYSHTAGDRFIFKGGVTWPNAAFPITIAAGGNGSISDYYGVDATWYSGGSWTRPIFSGSGSAITGGKNQFIYNITSDYINYDSIEFDAFYWDSTSQSPVCGVTYVGNQIYNTFSNIYVHGWTHGTLGSGTLDAFKILHASPSSAGTGNVCANSTFDGSASSGDSGAGSYCWSTFINCDITHIPNACLTAGSTQLVDNCRISYITQSFNTPDVHANAIENLGTINPQNITVKNTVIHDTYFNCLFGGNAGSAITMSVTMYNNVMWNVTNLPCIGLDARDGGTETGLIYNNTLVTGDGQLVISMTSSPWANLTIKNNHFIGGSADTTGVTTLVTANNLSQSVATAAADGFLLSASYAPVSGADTIDYGATLGAPYNVDLLGVSRPNGAAYDAGAYEYVSVATGTTGPGRLKNWLPQKFGKLLSQP